MAGDGPVLVADAERDGLAAERGDWRVAGFAGAAEVGRAEGLPRSVVVLMGSKIASQGCAGKNDLLLDRRRLASVNSISRRGEPRRKRSNER